MGPWVEKYCTENAIYNFHSGTGFSNRYRPRPQPMPVHVRISHTDRLAIAVGHGTITADEFQKAAMEFSTSGALHYRKLIDVAAAKTDADLSRIKALVTFMRTVPGSAERGPLAFVVDASRGDVAREIAAMTEEGERPVAVFTNLHEARKWLDKTASISLRG